MTKRLPTLHAVWLPTLTTSSFGQSSTQPEYDEYDPLLNGAPITEPVAVAAAATTATQSWPAPVEPVTQTPPVASVDVPPAQSTVAWQPVPGPQTGEPVIAPAPEGYPQQPHNMRSLQCNIMSRCNNQYSHSSRIMHLQLNNLRNNPITLLRRNNLFSNRITQLRRNSLRNSRITPLRQNKRWQVTPGKPKSSNPLFAPQSTYQTEQTYQQPAAQEPLYQQPQPAEQQPVVSLNPL